MTSSGYFQKIPASNKKPSVRQQPYFSPLPERPPPQPQAPSSMPLWPAPFPSPYPSNRGPPPPPPPGNRMPRQGPMTFGTPAPIMSTAKTLTNLGRTLAPNDYVEVNLRARGWVLGVVIAICELANTLCKWRYKVRFLTPGGYEEEGEFGPEDVRRALPPDHKATVA